MKELLILLSVFVCLSCSRTDCSKIPTAFNSYEEAQSIVTQARFVYTDEINTGKSSWIQGAEYYSCDNQTGFFILKTDGKNYIYQEMPREVWDGFKNAESFGSYYNSAIKYRYQLSLRE